ncbi:hypothetical protein FRC11_000943 [Ceratobasidium sp. 423]|nr:hypothetical protein FRC11_000943 [Ceratobasidium sp. 423]
MKLNIPRLLRTLSISPRVRKANLIANSHSAIRDLIERLLESGPPVTLSELSLCEQRDCDETNQPGVILSNTSDCWDSFCELLKSLSILRVRGAHFDWNDLTFSHRLVELQIQNVMMGSDTEDFAEFLRNLSLAPNLRDLKIISVQSSFDLHSLTIVPPERKIYLPSLESLFLADLPYNTLITVMDHIALVSHRRIVHLTKRCIELVESPDDTIDLDEMFTHFKVVQTHIDVLALSGESDDGWLSPPDLHALLCSLPGLKTLKLSCWTLCEDQCRAIADMPVERSESEDGEFPQLEYLDLSRVRVEEEVWLKEVIITHPTRRMVLGGSILDRAESFEFVPLRGNEPIVDWMRLKVPDFIFTDDQAQPPEFSSNPPSAIREWELAGLSLSSALDKYLVLSDRLGDTALLENAHPRQLTLRIDSALQSLHITLSRQLTLAHSTLVRTRNRFASLAYRLPQEILTEILLDAVAHPIDQLHPISMETTMLQMFRDLYSLQLVCRAWRNVIVSRGSFWRFAPIYCTGTPDLRCTLAPNPAIERSQRDLYLAAVIKLNIPRLLCALPISRLRKVNLTANSNSMIRGLIERLLEHGPPVALSELSLYEEIDRDEDDQDEDGEDDFVKILSDSHDCWNSFCELLQSLSIFRVRGAHFDWSNMSFSHRLVELRIQDVMMGPDTGGFTQFLKRLSLASNLRDLKIISVRSSFDSGSLAVVPPERKIHFPSLELLFFADLPYNTLVTLMHYIAPGSHSQTLYLTEQCTEIVGFGIDSANWESLLIHFKATQAVNTLVLSGQCIQNWLSVSNLQALFCSLPGIKSLKLSCWMLSDAECYALAGLECERGAGKFPQLEYLDLSRVRIQNEDWLKEVVNRHPIRRMVLGGFILKDAESSEFVSLQGNEPIVDWLRLNVPDFTFTDDQAQPPEFSSGVWQLW